MAFKPNYRLQRVERARAKQAKAEEKLKNRQARKTTSSEPEDIVAEPEEGDPQ